MTDRYENIRKALEMGPAPGPYKQSEFTPQRVDTRSGSINVAWYCNFDNGAREEEAEATAAHIAACDPDTIRAMLAERDALREALGRILENEASDWKAAEEFGGYVLGDELREEARAALTAQQQGGRDHG